MTPSNVGALPLSLSVNPRLGDWRRIPPSGIVRSAFGQS